jgi:hypothetical protein
MVNAVPQTTQNTHKSPLISRQHMLSNFQMDGEANSTECLPLTPQSPHYPLVGLHLYLYLHESSSRCTAFDPNRPKATLKREDAKIGISPTVQETISLLFKNSSLVKVTLCISKSSKCTLHAYHLSQQHEGQHFRWTKYVRQGVQLRIKFFFLFK